VTRGDIDMDHVGMWADGSGAAIAILAASVDPRIKALDLLDPWGDWPKCAPAGSISARASPSLESFPKERCVLDR